MTSKQSITTQPVVSVIMPVFNAEQTLKRAVRSVLSQTFNEWELLLIDDGSTDASSRISSDLQGVDPRIIHLPLSQNSGAAVARNAGIKAARGRYIAFLDADDEWLETKLERQIAMMKACDARLSYTGFWRKTGDSRTRVEVPENLNRGTLLKGNVIGCLTAIYDRDHFPNARMPDLEMRQDFAFWLDLMQDIDLAHGLNEPLAVHYDTPNSLSSRRGRAMRATWQMYRQHIGLSVPLSTWYLINHLLRRILRG